MRPPCRADGRRRSPANARPCFRQICWVCTNTGARCVSLLKHRTMSATSVVLRLARLRCWKQMRLMRYFEIGSIHLHPGQDENNLDKFRIMMHKLMHSDPAGAVYNLLQNPDGTFVFPSGKITDDPRMCSYLSVMGETYLRKLIAVAEELFPDEQAEQ
jgi:hypothetical protein